MVTKSEPNSGKSSLTNTELTPLVPITEIQIFNLKESTSTSMKPLEEDTFQELSLWILNQELWIQLELDHSVNFSDQTTSFSDKLELVTTGLKVTTLKELNSSTQSSTSLERRLRAATAFRASRSPTPSAVVPAPAWEPF